MASALVVQVNAQNASQTNGGAAASSTTAAEQKTAVDESTLPLGESATAQAEPEAGAGSTIGSIVRTILALALVAAAVYGVVFFLKRLARPAENRDPHLKVLATAHLGSNRFVHVIGLGQKAYLIGASDGGVDLIAEVDDPETRDLLLLEESRREAERPGPFTPDFRTLLARFSGDKRAASGPSMDSIRKKRERLRGI